MVEALTPVETQWLDGIYRRFGEKVFATCLQYAAGDRSWAQDRVHDVFVQLIRDRDKLRDADEPGGWIYRCTVNTCLMAIRRKGVWQRIRERLLPERSSQKVVIDGHLAARRDLQRLAKALRDLPARQRLVMTMIYLEQKSQKEVSEVLSLSKGQVSKLHSAALARLGKTTWETVSND